MFITKKRYRKEVEDLKDEVKLLKNLMCTLSEKPIVKMSIYRHTTIFLGSSFDNSLFYDFLFTILKNGNFYKINMRYDLNKNTIKYIGIETIGNNDYITIQVDKKEVKFLVDYKDSKLIEMEG